MCCSMFYKFYIIKTYYLGMVVFHATNTFNLYLFQSAIPVLEMISPLPSRTIIEGISEIP